MMDIEKNRYMFFDSIPLPCESLLELCKKFEMKPNQLLRYYNQMVRYREPELDKVQLLDEFTKALEFVRSSFRAVLDVCPFCNNSTVGKIDFGGSVKCSTCGNILAISIMTNNHNLIGYRRLDDKR